MIKLCSHNLILWKSSLDQMSIKSSDSVDLLSPSLTHIDRYRVSLCIRALHCTLDFINTHIDYRQLQQKCYICSFSITLMYSHRCMPTCKFLPHIQINIIFPATLKIGKTIYAIFEATAAAKKTEIIILNRAQEFCACNIMKLMQ